ncbi:YSIRK-type signal peptide-containing protein [Limosilactobacillus albertensis]|uniref:mucin-binding protein n=1 Tax=Limosilactobacillus albertensis TaxID=2759752 RepID=UPI001E412EF5|nr:YSIRK-type signal peptide-containing protein [Limosilactobacillus albertensis]MCD7118571.1 YSIRK-type signal peptide-containing protein [Limosilactobacillus albertensis]MCD7128384.1 YSIRK-type signal peptide-containing protein [Limosilactobacillus albertensis]
MLSRNNHQEQFKKYEPKKQRFTIKKLSVGVASVLLGISFANGVSADTTDNANVNSGGDKNGSSEETDHNLVLNSVGASTLKEATAANQANNASAAVQNPAGDVTTPTANKYEAAVSAAMANATTPDTTADSNAASQGSQSTTPAQSSANSQATTDSTINQPTSNAVETQTFNVADAANATNGFDYSSLFTSFAAVPSENSGAVDLSTYTPDFNITNNSDYNTYFSNIPSTQFGFQAHRDNRNGAILTLATDKDNPGDKIYFYVNGSLKATIDKNAATAPWSGTMNISQTNGNVYKGGTYNYSRSTVTIGGYKYTKVAVEDADGKSPVNVPTTGAFTTGGANLVPLGIGSSELTQKQWQSGGGVIPDKAHQTIWYVNADTGEVMASKTSGYVFGGQSYDVTDAAPEKVTYKNKTYELVARGNDGNYTNVNPKALNSALTKNNGVDITVGDVIDTPLKGTLGSSRKGDIYVSTTDYGPSRIYISQQIDNDGTISLNTYDVNPSDLGRGQISATFINSGNISAQSLKSGEIAQGDKSALYNGHGRGNQDVVFLYRIKQNATISFVDDDNGSSLSPAQNATGNADTQITFDNAASTVSNILSQGYTYVQTTGNGVTGGNTGSFSGVTFPNYDSDADTTQSFVVHFKKAAPTVSYTYGEPETATVHRTINYYDKVTGAKIPSNLIAQNPVTDEVTFTRTPVLENGVKVGYGTINADGTGYTKQDWHTADGEVGSTQFAAKRSNDLFAYNYTAPEFRDGKSASVVPADTVTPTTKDIVYDVYYGHQTQPVNTTKTVTRHFHYVFTDGSDPASKLTPQTDQTVTFNGTATKDLVTGKTSDTVYTPATGTLDQVKGQAVDGYKIVGYTNGTPDGGAVALNVTPTSGDTDVTIVYTPIDKPKPQADEKASVKIVDQDTNKTLGTFKNQGVAGDNITFAGEPETLTTLINSGYTWVSAVNDKNGSSIGDQNSINFGNFDNDTTTDQAFTITLKHGQKVTNEQGASTATVHYVIAGNDANKPAAPADNGPQTINWTRTVTTDQVTGDITYGNWTPDKQTFDSITSPTVTGYTPDKATATFTTPVVNKDQVVTVVYSKAPEQDQKADLIVYDKTDNNKQLNNFDNSGKAGTQITFSGAANYIADLIAKGYQIDSFVNDQNVTSNPSSYSQISYDNFDSNANSDQHFKLYLVHGTEPATQTKNTTSTVHYVVLDGKATPPADHTETITWTQPGTKDKVTGAFTPTGNWTTPDHYTDVPSPSLEGYTVDKTNVPAPTPNPDQNPTTTVTYSPKTPEAPTYTGTDEVREVTRTINYYDKVTGQKIPADLIHDNPTTQTVQLKRTHVVSSTGQDMGYGTISNDGKTFTKATTADGWNTGSWNQVVSPILTNAGYTAPDLAQADQVNVTAATKDAVVNVYYGHETVLVTPDKPQNPGDKINPNDPRNNPPAYPDGLTKTDLQQSVTRTINYKGINENGQTVDVNGAPDGKNTYTQTVNFERHAVVDKVTGEVLGYDTNADTVTPVVTTTDANRAWMPASQNMASVASKAPSEVGYDNVDLSTVGGMTVYPGQQISDVTVTYTKNKTPEVTQKATLEIIDNNDANAPKQLASFGNEGKSTDQITFANSDQILQGYLNQGYTVQKTDGNLSGSAQTGYTYPTYGSTAQDFKIYLVHDTKEVTENATATAQVHYVVADNGVQAPADSTLQTITYSRTNTVDKVTGATVNEGTWKADKNAFTDVKSPDLSNDGYTPSVDNVQFNAPERGVNQRVTVVYNRSAQAADLQIIDDNDPANQTVLAVYSNNGESGKAISFNGSNEQLKNYLDHGYTFEKTDGQGMKGDATNGFTYPSFDNDAKSNQSFKIYLKHGTKDQTTTATANAHVHYIMADGTKAPDDSATQTVTWTRTDTVDAVTGAVKATGQWGTLQGSFTSVASPKVAGYTPGTETVNFATPEPNKNQVVNVVYTKNPETPATQKAVVVYQDVNDPAHVVELTRSSELTGNAGDAVNYSTADEIAKLENEGYVLVSNGFDPNGAKPSFDNINDNTQTFYVTLKHGIQPVNPTTPGTPSEPINPNDPNPAGPKYPAGTDKTSLTHDVTRTVTYEGAGEQTPSPVTDTLHFQGAGYLDKVTGKWTDANGKELADQTKGITWTIIDGTKDNGSFDLVPTKHINGYTSQVETAGADDGNGNVKSYTGINHSTADINVVVKYSPVVAEKGNLIVKFHDDTDNKDLTGVGTDTGSQDVGTNVTYNSDTDLTNLENKGYVYVSTDGKIPASIVKGTTTVTIHVKHGLQPVNPSTPGKPDQPINPNDPDPKGPKYPAGTDKASIDKTITRTIHYEGADQYTPSDVQQPVHFTASGVLDKVTGRWATPLTWSSETETFGAKSSPKIPGYHVVSVDRDTTDHQNVDNATISHNGSDYTVTVKYAKDEAPTPETTTGKVVYIDDTTNQTLKTDPLNGNVNANIDYTTQDKINDYVNEGYKLVSNNFTDGRETFNGDASKNNFEVHLVHTYVPITPANPGTPGGKINPNDPRPEGEQPKYPAGTDEKSLTKTITRTIQYQGAGDYTPESVQQPVNFTATGEIDRVTGQWSKQLTWSPDQTFGTKTTPKIPGYHVVSVDRDANGENVAATPIAHTGSDYTVTVTYAPDEKAQVENAKLHIIDINDGNKEIGGFTATGDDNTAINFAGANTTIDALIKSGYKVNSIKHTEKSGVVNDGGEGADYGTISGQWKFDDQPGFDQDFYVYLEHDITPINPENAYGRTDLTRTVTETVHYVDEATNKPVASDYTNKATFTGHGMVDKVTGKMLAIKSIENGTYDKDLSKEIDISSAKDSDFVWTSPATFARVGSPVISGYTVDAAKTTPSDLADGDGIKKITNVAYNHDNVEATVYYKANPAETHKAGLTIYANGQSVGTVSVTGAKDTAINFGSASGIVAAYLNNGYKFDHAQDVTNNKEMAGKSYSELNFGNFATENNSNQEFAIYLTKEAPAVEKGSIKVTVHDVKTNQDVPGYDANSGSENVGTKFTYDTTGNIAKLKDAGYKVLNPDVQIPTEISKGDQSFVIYVDHNVVPVTPENPGNGLDKDALQKSVTETVKYVVNGDQAKAPADHTATLHFDGTAYYDSVTKKWTDASGNELADQTKNITWTANDGHQFDTVISPVVTGYHVTSVSDNYNDGNGNVKAVPGMDQNSSNFTVTVTYDKDAEPTKDQGSLTVIVHDVTDNKDLDEYGKKSGTQEVGYNFEFNKATTISELENKGYKVLNPDVTIPTQVTKGDYSYTIYVQHNIVPVTPDKPGNGLDHDQLTKTVTETVHYVVNGGTAKAPADKTASLVFNGTGYYDAVTKQWTDADGKVLADQTKNITWTAQDGNKFSVVVTPRLEGYNASVQEGYDDGNNNVKEISGINQTSNNVDVTVTYTPATPAKTQQNAQLVIQDVTPGQEMQLGSYTQPGLEGDPISFGDAQQRIQDLLGKGYVWDGATYNGANLSATDYAGIAFGNYDNTDDNSGISQKWVINLVHRTTPVNPDHPDDKDGYTKDYLDRTITRDVTYVDAQGNEMKGLTPEHQEAKFTGSGYLDKVTGKWVTVENGKITGLAKGLTWTPDTDSTFDAINAKSAEGYHVISVTGNGISGFTVGQDGAVTAQTVNRDTPSSKITVVYAPDTKAPVAANGSIVYIDDTTGNTLESASFGGTVGGKINYTTADRVTYYEGKGYNVVSNNFNDGNETFKEGDNKFEVHLTHVTDTKNVTKTVTRDVTYIYEDGSQADTPVNQSVTFNGKTTTDKVTGAEKTVWDNDSQNFAATKSIDTTQYNIVKVSENNTAANVDMTNGVVAGETITPTSQNSKVVITLAKKAIPTPDQGSLTVVFHDDTEGHDIEGYGTKTGNENVGTDVTYKADTDLTNLENKGYVYVSTDGTIPGKITKGATTVTIHVKHGTRPVTPENPADPGKPVDPNKPNTATPSNPNLAKTDLEKAITRIVKYQYTDGTSAHADAVQTVNFKGQGTIDLVTGNLVNVDKDGNIVDQRGKITWDHDSQDFGNVAAIDHDGYYVSSITETGTTAKVDGTAVAGETVNPNSQNSTIVITLTKKPVTPTPVQKGTVIVNYVDKTTGKTLETATSTGNEGSNVDYSTKDTITKYTNQGYKLDHDGYPTGTVTYTNGTVTYEVDLVHDTVPVNPDQPGPKTPNTPINPNDPNGPKYPDGTQPSQLTKTVTRTINYVGDGLNIPSVQKEVQFVANGVLDKVTGQWVTVDNNGKITGTANGMTWTVKGGNTDEGSFDQVAGPQTDGYYISGISSTNEAASDVDKTTGTVAGKTINHTNGNITITINYAKNPVTPTPTPADQTVVGKQIVHYVDGDNNNAKLLDDNTNDTFVFTKSGKTGTWNTDSHKYANANAPVIDGYVAEQKTYEGQTATPGDANKEITIVYHKIGKIIPVDPTGNPIPDAPTPGYHNDPTDPTKVTPNEPTPDVPGWTTNVPNVTPDTPTGDTKVPYTKPTPTQDKGSITITVHDVTDNTDLPEYGKTSGSQNVGTSFSYDKTGTFTSLTNKGYKVVNPDVTIPTGITKGDQNIVIYVEHTTTPITPENPGKPGQPINPNDPTGPQYPNGSDQVTKNVTRTITYVDNNGNKLHDPVEQTAHFTGTGVIDNVTGKWVTPITWTGNGDLNGQNTPVIDGYHVTNVSRDGNGNNVAKVTVNHGDSDYTVVVTYTPNGKIVPVDPTGNPIPDVPTPQYPTDPSDPAKVTPNEPVPTIPGYTPEVPSVTPTNPGEDTPVVYTPVTPATVQGKVTYIDDTTGKTITTDNFSGKVGDKITYTTAGKISDLEGKGYELVSNNFKDGSETFTDGENSFVVHLKHAETIFTPQNPHGGDDESGKYATQKKTTFTVHYVGAGEKNPADHVETVQWHRHVSVDGVTGEVISSTPWTTDDSYSNVNTPVVDGYHADKAVANAPQADPDKDSVETVTYAPNGHIIPVDQTGTPIPGADHPVYPTDPNDPTKVTPNEPVPTVPGYTPEQETVTPVDPGTNTPVIYDRGTTPVTPEQPETPGNPGGDDNETPNKVTPNTPANPGDNGNEEGKKVTPQSPATPAENTPAASAEPQAPVAKQAAAQKPAAKSDAKTLPQTGNDENNSAAVLGLAALGLTGLVGLGKKRRKED